MDEWSEELVEIEARAKAKARCLLFVIDGQTRSLASVTEVIEHICCGRTVVLVVTDMPADIQLNGHVLQPDELKDLNRMRAYVRDVATRHGVPTYDSVPAACFAMCNEVELLKKLKPAPRAPRPRLHSMLPPGLHNHKSASNVRNANSASPGAERPNFLRSVSESVQHGMRPSAYNASSTQSPNRNMRSHNTSSR